MFIDVTGRYSERMLGDVVHKLWDLTQAGLAGEMIGLKIGLKIGWSTAAVHAHIREHGGVRPCWGRELLGRFLSMSERERLLEIKVRHGVRKIARRLGRSPSTISQELKRHCGPNDYRATRAHALAFELAKRPKEAKLTANEALSIRVQNDLRGCQMVCVMGVALD